jgi:hypothetical protein
MALASSQWETEALSLACHEKLNPFSSQVNDHESGYFLKLSLVMTPVPASIFRATCEDPQAVDPAIPCNNY